MGDAVVLSLTDKGVRFAKSLRLSLVRDAQRSLKQMRTAIRRDRRADFVGGLEELTEAVRRLSIGYRRRCSARRAGRGRR